jgi:subtilisin family serine protease
VRRTTLLAATVAATVLLAAGLPATAGPRKAAGAQQYIVVLHDSAAASTIAKLHAAAYGLDLGHIYRSALKGYSATMTAGAASVLEALPIVKWVEPDRSVSTFAQTVPTGVNRADADLSPTAAIDGTDQRVNVDVAVIDTGVDLDHPDLNVHQAGAKNCSLFGLIPSADDDNGHGSHVAGTIGALDNSIGVVGMAPGARIWPVKVLSAAGVGLNSDVICGIDYVAANADQIEVANMSLGGEGTDDGDCGRTDGDAEHLAICNAVGAGVTFAVAAGNESQDAANVSPASYDEVITVSALADFNGQPGGGAASTCRADGDDTFADFSNFGADVDIIAPGVCIDSTYMQGMYDTLSGTSMASPHVAGAAALYKANNPAATPARVKAALQGAGTSNWDDADDPDNTKEPLLNASGL